ncbi:MAG TPA: YciI family protein [Steroidobacteraceae bacterium]|nr:YciI family protein [Steroidobacteraceae bacterium]
MKYILMMQFPLADWKTSRMELWPPQDAKAHLDFLRRFNKELTETGEFVRTEGLGGPEQMKVVRAKKDGTPVITDGPFAESKEILAGYWIVDVETPQRAYELAARASAAPGPGGAPLCMPIEVHPVMMSLPSNDV